MKKIKLDFEAVSAISKDKAIGAIINGNAFFEMNLITGECSYLGFFPGEALDGNRLFCSAAYYNRKVYFIPNSAKCIQVYDVENKSIRSIEINTNIDKKYKSYNAKFKFADCLIYEQKLIMLCATYPAIITMNLLTEELNYDNSWLPNEGYFFRKGKMIKDGCVWLPSCNNNIVLKYNLSENSAKIYRCGDDARRGSWSMVDMNNHFVLAPKNDSVLLETDDNLQPIGSIDIVPKFAQKTSFYYNKCYRNEEGIFMVPQEAGSFLKMDIESGQLSNINVCDIEKNDCVDYLFELENDLFVRIRKPNKECEYVIIDMATNDTRNFEFSANLDSSDFYKNYWANSKGYITKESEIFTLENYIKSISEV